MDPIPNALTTLLNVIQGVAQPTVQTAAPVQALLALAGQEVGMVLLGQAAGGGLSLALPSGQVVTAQGQLPYPDGTQLLVRVLAGSGPDAALRLQTLQAAPPAAPAILAPLNQGEAAGLLASLGQAEPPPGLESLVALFRQLGGGAGSALADAAQAGGLASAPAGGSASAQAGGSASASAPAGGSASAPAGVPASALSALPAQAQAALKTLLALPASATPAATASALEAWLGAAPAASRSADPVQELLQRFQGALEAHPEAVRAQAGPLVTFLRTVLTAPAAQGDGAGPAAQALQARPGAATPAAPETWETWLRGSVKALSDPAISPQAAPFHAAQAKEGTAFYEIPLPWAPQSPLQMWVESDRDPREPGGAQVGTQRVLLGLSFSNLGETRLGLARSPAGLQVRVWTEHPELLEASRAGVEAELQDLGGSVDLKVIRLSPGPGGAIPSLRSQVTGATLQAMG